MQSLPETQDASLSTADTVLRVSTVLSVAVELGTGYLYMLTELHEPEGTLYLSGTSTARPTSSPRSSAFRPDSNCSNTNVRSTTVRTTPRSTRSTASYRSFSVAPTAPITFCSKTTSCIGCTVKLSGEYPTKTSRPRRPSAPDASFIDSSVPTHSYTTSAPAPPVIRRILSAAVSSDAFTATSAPSSSALSSFAALRPTAIVRAPVARASCTSPNPTPPTP